MFSVEPKLLSSTSYFIDLLETLGPAFLNKKMIKRLQGITIRATIKAFLISFTEIVTGPNDIV